jgi:methylthioribose-1-phosphate isomerase
VDPIPPTIEWQRGRVRLIDQRAPSEPSSYRPARACSRIATRDPWRPSATAPLSASCAAHDAGKRPMVLAGETRPVLQGVRLTAWELDRLGIPLTVIADAMAGSLMATGDVDVVVVGADRIAANGDVADKIGTYPLAVLACEHDVPFIVAAPTSTIDLATPEGAAIPVEERPDDEVVRIAGERIAPDGVPAANRAFDVTPARLVTAFVTERGVLRPPYEDALRAAASA